uniref:Secreted protein n=1 Tax=Anguilla anguilla TaxID=7936 RepID=A0A0E9W4X5_ANGAN
MTSILPLLLFCFCQYGNAGQQILFFYPHSFHHILNTSGDNWTGITAKQNTSRQYCVCSS